jgi:hypothetical protein
VFSHRTPTAASEKAGPILKSCLSTLPITLPSAENFHAQAAAFDDAFQRANRNRLAAVHGHNHLPSVFVSPFLVAARLTDTEETMPAQNFNDFFGVTDWKPPAHGTASSSSLES